MTPCGSSSSFIQWVGWMMSWRLIATLDWMKRNRLSGNLWFPLCAFKFCMNQFSSLSFVAGNLYWIMCWFVGIMRFWVLLEESMQRVLITVTLGLKALILIFWIALCRIGSFWFQALTSIKPAALRSPFCNAVGIQNEFLHQHVFPFRSYFVWQIITNSSSWRCFHCFLPGDNDVKMMNFELWIELKCGCLFPEILIHYMGSIGIECWPLNML